jgi:DNA-binding transcriptional regulator YdaS (Cro superfamily)
MARLGYRGREAAVTRALAPPREPAEPKRRGRPPVELSLNLVMPVQFYPDAGAACRAGEKRLMLAVLADAIDSLLRGATATSERRRRLCAEAEAWFQSDDVVWPFSFVNLCEALGLDPSYVRQRLARCRASCAADRADTTPAVTAPPVECAPVAEDTSWKEDAQACLPPGHVIASVGASTDACPIGVANC